MGIHTSRDVNQSPRRLNKLRVKNETPIIADGTALTPTGADDRIAARSKSKTYVTLNCVAYSSFLGAECITGWEDGSIQCLNWRSAARDAVNIWKPHSQAVNQLVIKYKLQMIYSCSQDSTVAITPNTEKPASETATMLRGHQLNVTTVAVDVAEQMLCSGGYDTRTIFWDLTTSYIVAKNTTPQNVVTCSMWLPGETLVAQGSEDLSVKFWDPRTPLRVPVQTLEGLDHFPLSIAAHGNEQTSDSTYLLASSKGFNGIGCEARVWDRCTGRQLIKYQAHQHDALACCFLPKTANKNEVKMQVDSGHLWHYPVTASKDGTVKVWDTSSLSPFAEAYTSGFKRMFTSLCKVDNSTVLASTIGGQVLAYSLDRKRRTLTLIPCYEDAS